MASWEDNIQALLEPAIVALGFDLWGLEHLPQGKHSLLRLYIDAEQGVTVDDCAAVSRQVVGILDVENPIRGQYTLEVSSPGLDRLLFKLAHYPAYVGQRIQLRLRTPCEGRRKFKGTLKGVAGAEVVVQVDDREFSLPHSAIERARVMPQR